ncbi:MAG: DEAD/DEAH box helicase [archaeon]|nr:DEAD/DEAH box helicase [archaeon]
MTSFEDLGISAKLIDAMNEMGWSEPTPVQCEAVPLGIAGNDLIAKAQTGTGKTGAYSMIIMSRVGKGSKVPSALVITPTRELAMQVDAEIKKFSKFSGHVSAAVYGQVPYERQINMLRRGVDIVVGTPGRLKDLIEREALDLSEVREVVLDEADRMLDIGFENELNFIMEQVPEVHQTLLFSATLSKQVMRLANNMLENPAEVDISGDDPTTGLTKQYIIPCKRNEKKTILYELLDKGTPKTIVFFATKSMVDEIYDEMKSDGEKVGTLHGDMPQKLRERVINDFRDNRILTLLATDVASRGLDVTDVDMVINYDLPIDPETYLHRIGRTGRAGKEGVSISIVNPRDKKLVRMCEDEADTEMERIEPDDLEPIEAVHEPVFRERPKKEKKMKVEKHRNNDRRYSGEREGFATLEINLGKADGLSRIEISDFLKQRASIEDDGIGKVGLKDDRCFVEVSLDHSDYILENLNGCELNGKTVTITEAPQKQKYQSEAESDDGFNRRRENRYKNYEKRKAREAEEAEEESEEVDMTDSEESFEEEFREERPRRSFGDRPRRDYNDRGYGRRDDRRGGFGRECGYGRDRGYGDRPRRDRDFGDRPRRDRGFGDREYVRRDFGERSEGSEDRREFRERRDFGDRPRREGGFGRRDDRRGGFGDRPRRDRDFGDRPRRDRDFGDRPRRDFEDRPKRDFGDREERPRFSERGDRPRRDREFGDRPRREGGFGRRDERRGGFGDRPRRDRDFGDRPRRDGGFGDRPRRDRDDRRDRPRREDAGNGSRRINAKRYPSNRDKPKDKKRGKY